MIHLAGRIGGYFFVCSPSFPCVAVWVGMCCACLYVDVCGLVGCVRSWGVCNT